MKEYPIGMSTFSQTITLENLIARKEAGIEAIEVNLSEPYTEYDFEGLRKNAEKAGVKLWSIHHNQPLESYYVPIDSPWKRNAINDARELINRAAAAGIENIVVHPMGAPEPNPFSREEQMKHVMDFLDELAEYAHPKNARIALENLPRNCLGNRPEEILHMISVNDKVKVCFDFNHSLLQPTEDFIKAVGSHIVTVHVSDRDHINERHWLPGEGVVDWKRVMDQFDEIGYQGIWMYEVKPDPEGTIDRRVLEYKDYVENARALFRRETPVKIGTPKPKLGMWGPEE